MENESPDIHVDSNERNQRFMRLYLGIQRHLHGYVLSMVPSPTDADDIVQNTVATMLSEFDGFKPGTDFVAWALTVARYQILTYYKQKKTTQRRFSEIALEAIQDVSESISKQEDRRREALDKCLEKLKEKERKILYFRYEMGATLRTVAERMDLNINTLYSVLSRIHISLLTCIDKNISSQR